MSISSEVTEELSTINIKELVEKVNSREISILKSLGAEELYDEMAATGRICCNLVDSVCAEKDDRKLRKLAVNLLRPTAPAKLLKSFPKADGCVVLGFNHPSLGEIFRLIYLGLEAYPDKEFLFPVNIPWYENLTPCMDNLKRLGIHIVPMITPKTAEKLHNKYPDDPEISKLIDRLKKGLEHNYRDELKENAKRNGLIIVAPSATRQATVFPSAEAKADRTLLSPTMSFIARLILKDESVDAIFVPVVVFEPYLGNRKLNLFRYYRIYPCRAFHSDQVRAMCDGKSKEFDYKFLNRMDKVYKRKKY